MKLKILIYLNITMLIIGVGNIVIKKGYILKQYWTWDVEGCPSSRIVEYKPVEYGDYIPLTELICVNGDRQMTIDSTRVTHLIVLPFHGVPILNRVEYLNDWVQDIDASLGRTIILLYKPYSNDVPDRAWRYAEVWASSQWSHVVIDRIGDLGIQLQMDPCDCLYQLIWDNDGQIIWAAKGFIGDHRIFDLISRTILNR